MGRSKNNSNTTTKTQSTEIAKVEDKKTHAGVLSPEFSKQIAGTDKQALALDLLIQGVQATPSKSSATSNLELMANTLQELKPQNALEGILCTQLASLHFLGMSYLKRAEGADMRCHQDPDLNNAVKLLRLQHETIECLTRLRRNGEQKVVVQHVQVNQGGQAIVGNVVSNRGGGGHPQKTDEVIP